MVAVARTLVRRGAVAYIFVAIAFVGLIRMRGRSQSIARVVGVIVCSRAVDHLRDVVDGV